MPIRTALACLSFACVAASIACGSGDVGAGSGGAASSAPSTSTSRASTGAGATTTAASTSSSSTASSNASSGAGGSGGMMMTNYPPPTTLCANGDGLYCGVELGMDADTLYQCQGGNITVSSQCAGACIVKPGQADACPCPSGDGLYCGSEVGLDANTLYDCQQGAFSVDQVCAGSCQIASPGMDDSCASCPSGDGLYCGSEVGADQNTLYECMSGALTVQEKCPGACQVNPPGQADACGACPSGDGLYCGSEVGADQNTLYNCQNGALTVAQKCTGACQVNPPGQADACGGSCPNGNGLYCGQEVGGDSSTLYDCENGALSVSQVCNGACVVEPQGQSDACPSSCGSLGAAALGWEAGQLSNGQSWSDECLGFVNNAFKAAGDSIPELGAYSALDSLHEYENEGKLVAWGGSAPCGAIVFWDGNSCNGGYGHVVISNGDGTVSTSGWPGFGGSAHASISWMDSMECGNAPAGYVVP